MLLNAGAFVGSNRSGFPDDFPHRLERLRESVGLTWKGLARAAGLSLRAIHRWRKGAKPDVTHLLMLLDFAAEHDALECLLDRPRSYDRRQGILFDDETWNRLAGGEASMPNLHTDLTGEDNLQRPA